MSIYSESLELHEKNSGKIDVISKIRIQNDHDLSLVYTPGVAEPCRVIAKNPEKLNTYTARGNTIAVVSDGSAVLGLGNIGARAALPVMEGKCILFKEFGGVSAFPICIDNQDGEEIINIVKSLEPSFSGINLEDIAAPRCFEIENRLMRETNMLIFHDDQHGTAIVTLAGLFNALKIVGKDIKDIKIIVNGAGAAGTSITNLLAYLGVRNIIVCDSKGIIYRWRKGLNITKKILAKITNPENVNGSLADAIKDADVFIGVSVADALNPEILWTMSKKPIIFALANPEPEIKPEIAKLSGVKIIATGRSDYPNQVNNVLAFPGIFRGALDAKAKYINMEMKLAAAKAIASIIEDELDYDYIIPKLFDSRILPAVVRSVVKAAVTTGISPSNLDIELIEAKANKIAKSFNWEEPSLAI